MALVPQESTGPSVSLSKVPSVRQLCELLGIQHASLKDSTVFMDAIHAWRKTSTTSDGSPATTLLNWNSQSVQKDLRSAAVKFLENNDNGYRFWAPSRSWAQPSDLYYPEHRDRIIDLLVQLFWKQNRYLRNNSYYSSSKPTDSYSRDGSADQSTPARESYEQSAASPSTTSFQPQKKKKKNGNKKSTTLTRPIKVGTAPTVIAEGAERRGVSATHGLRMVDIYDVPDSSDDDDAQVRTFASAQTSKHSRNERPDCEKEARKRKRHQTEESPRRTERRRNPRTMPWVAPQEEVNMILDMEEDEAGVDPPTSLSSEPEMQQSDQTLGLQPRSTISVSEEPAHTTSKQNNLPNDPFAAPTAPMISTRRPTAPKPSLPTEQPAPSMKVVRLKMPPSLRLIQKPRTLSSNPTAGAQSATSQTKIQKAALGETASSGLEQGIAASTGRRSTASPASAQSARKAASVSSNNDEATVSLGSAREDSGLSSLGGSLSTNDAYAGPPRKPLTPPLQSTTTSNAARKLPSVAMQHVTLEPSIVSQASSQPSAPVPRPRIQIPFWIITREPLYTEELWNEGKFQGLPLADFLEGITKVTQRSHIEKIKLTLRTPFSNTILTVHGDSEDAWTTAKATFAEKLKESRAEARARRVDDSGRYKILIEPFYEQVIMTGGGAEADDDVFDY